MRILLPSLSQKVTKSVSENWLVSRYRNLSAHFKTSQRKRIKVHLISKRYLVDKNLVIGEYGLFSSRFRLK